MVILSKIDGPSHECTTQHEISEALKKAHKRKYTAAWGNPPLKLPIKNIIGKYGVTTETRELLNGKYKKRANADQYSNLLLSHIKGIRTQDLPMGISRRDHQER